HLPHHRDPAVPLGGVAVELFARDHPCTLPIHIGCEKRNRTVIPASPTPGNIEGHSRDDWRRQDQPPISLRKAAPEGAAFFLTRGWARIPARSLRSVR